MLFLRDGWGKYALFDSCQRRKVKFTFTLLRSIPTYSEAGVPISQLDVAQVSYGLDNLRFRLYLFQGVEEHDPLVRVDDLHLHFTNVDSEAGTLTIDSALWATFHNWKVLEVTLTNELFVVLLKPIWVFLVQSFAATPCPGVNSSYVRSEPSSCQSVWTESVHWAETGQQLSWGLAWAWEVAVSHHRYCKQSHNQQCIGGGSCE